MYETFKRRISPLTLRLFFRCATMHNLRYFEITSEMCIEDSDLLSCHCHQTTPLKQQFFFLEELKISIDVKPLSVFQSNVKFMHKSNRHTFLFSGLFKESDSSFPCSECSYLLARLSKQGTIYVNVCWQYKKLCRKDIYVNVCWQVAIQKALQKG